MNAQEWAPILQYRDLWDVPRIFVVAIDGSHFLFDCPWDSVHEDYESYYRVSMLPEDFLPPSGSWEGIEANAIARFNDISISEIEFDASRKAAVLAPALRRLLVKEGRSL